MNARSYRLISTITGIVAVVAAAVTVVFVLADVSSFFVAMTSSMATSMGINALVFRIMMRSAVAR